MGLCGREEEGRQGEATRERDGHRSEAAEAQRVGAREALALANGRLLSCVHLSLSAAAVILWTKVPFVQEEGRGSG